MLNLNSNGDIISNQAYAGGSSNYSFPLSPVKTSDNGLLLLRLDTTFYGSSSNSNFAVFKFGAACENEQKTLFF